MLRYVTFVWDSNQPEQIEAVQSLTQRLRSTTSTWRAVFDAAGMKVFCAGARTDSADVRLLHSQSGVVLGTLFVGIDDADSISAVAALEKQQSAAIVQSGGRELIDSYWGTYVAFIHDTETGVKSVLRGPASHLPCLRTQYRGVQIYFSLLQDVLALGLLRFSLNWSFIVTGLVAPIERGDTISRGTGLVEVLELQYGECVQTRGSSVSHKFYWEPYRIACADRIEDPAEAKRQLRRITKACTHAWASRHDVILVKLSGGIDSSIVLSCLVDAPTCPRIICVNSYSDGPLEDERVYARAAVENVNCELIEHRRNPEIRYADALNAMAFETPKNYLRMLDDFDLDQHLTHEYGISAIYSGTGGDQLFVKISPTLSAIDYVYDHGITPRLLEIAWDVARFEQISLGRVLCTALRYGLIPHGRPPLNYRPAASGLLTAQAIEVSERTKSSQRRFSVGVPDGKRKQISSVMNSQGFYHPMRPRQEPMYLSPLLSQPIIECCLRIPTYLACANGWDRAIARQAFDLHPMIAQRRPKGKFSKYLREVVSNNIDFMREVLFDGILVANGIVDPQQVQRVLAGGPSSVVKNTAEITRVLCIEVWLRLLTTSIQPTEVVIPNVTSRSRAAS